MALPACGVLCCGVLWCVLQIIVTHDQEEAFDLADKVVIFNRGLIEQVCVGGGGRARVGDGRGVALSGGGGGGIRCCFCCVMNLH